MPTRRRADVCGAPLSSKGGGNGTCGLYAGHTLGYHRSVSAMERQSVWRAEHLGERSAQNFARSEAQRKRDYPNYPGYAMALEAQHGLCAICRRPPRAAQRLAVDHDHKTGLWRGLLCFACNHTIVGHLEHFGVDRMLTGIAYVCDPPAERSRQ
jgi:hypothetical protein